MNTTIKAGSDVSEQALWRRAGWGLVWGFIIAGLLAYGLVELTSPEVSVASKIGLSLYVAFWSGPFIGLSGAVGYHELVKSRARRGQVTAAPSPQATSGIDAAASRGSDRGGPNVLAGH